MNLDISHTLPTFLEFSDFIFSNTPSHNETLSFLLISNEINLIDIRWNNFLTSHPLPNFQQIIEFAIDVVGTPPDCNNNPDCNQIRHYATNLLSTIISHKRISLELLQKMCQYIHNSLHIYDSQIINSIHNLIFTCIKTFYTEREFIISIFINSTHIYYHENTPVEIIYTNIEFWFNIYKYEFFYKKDIPTDQKIIFNTAKSFIPMFIQTMLKTELYDTPSGKSLISLITTLLTSLFKSIPYIIFTIYYDLLGTLTESHDWIDIHTALILILTIYKNDPTKIPGDDIYDSLIPFILSTVNFVLSQTDSQIPTIKNTAYSTTIYFFIYHSKHFTFDSTLKRLINNFLQSVNSNYKANLHTNSEFHILSQLISHLQSQRSNEEQKEQDMELQTIKEIQCEQETLQLESSFQWISQQLTETEPNNVSDQSLIQLEILEHDYMSEPERTSPRES
jgi:hypothetical protein